MSDKWNSKVGKNLVSFFMTDSGCGWSFKHHGGYSSEDGEKTKEDVETRFKQEIINTLTRK